MLSLLPSPDIPKGRLGWHKASTEVCDQFTVGVTLIPFDLANPLYSFAEGGSLEFFFGMVPIDVLKRSIFR